MKPENVVIGFAKSLEVRETIIGGKLFVAYLDSALRSEVDYLTLDEALEKGSVVIREMDTATVSDFKVENKSDNRVLLLMGEQLQGERQNRTINTTILIGEHQEVVIPVSCTEQGRWAYSGAKLKSEHLLHSRVRANLAEDVNATLRYARSYRGNQHKLWGNVASACDTFCVQSPTWAVDDVYSTYEKSVDDMAREFRIECVTNGLLGNTEGLIAVDAFASEGTLPSIWNKLIKSYLLDSLLCQKVRKMSNQEISDFLASLKDAQFEVYDSPGLGQSVRVIKNELFGCCLIYEDEVIHLGLFEQRAIRRKRNLARALLSPIRRFRII